MNIYNIHKDNVLLLLLPFNVYFIHLERINQPTESQ